MTRTQRSAHPPHPTTHTRPLARIQHGPGLRCEWPLLAQVEFPSAECNLRFGPPLKYYSSGQGRSAPQTPSKKSNKIYMQEGGGPFWEASGRVMTRGRPVVREHHGTGHVGHSGFPHWHTNGKLRFPGPGRQRLQCRSVRLSPRLVPARQQRLVDWLWARHGY
jgi:hypothetical protein